MRIAIFSPYLDTAGGGEKYILTIAQVLSDKSQVDVLIDRHLNDIGIEIIKKKLQNLLGLNLSKVNFKTAPVGSGSKLLQRLIFLKRYDWLFYLTDGSIFLSTANHSVIHFQVPFAQLPFRGKWNGIKRKSWDLAIFNSRFTAEYILKQWSIASEVIYPPVDTDALKPLSKKNQIISVGRFFKFTKPKKHEVMIETFKELSKLKASRGWSLHLVGGMGEGDEEYVESLKKQAEAFEIYFYPNASLDQLRKLYGESKIYWHAAGFGESDPEKWEHFGITTVEAMASGCVPVVINLGGQREIVEDKGSGFLWNDLTELKNQTSELMGNESLRRQLQNQAINRSRSFSFESFKDRIERLVYGYR